MKVAEARRVTSAAAAGCSSKGKPRTRAAVVKILCSGPASKLIGEWTKCSISTADVTAKKVDAPRQRGRKIQSAGSKMTARRQPAFQKAYGMRDSVRTSNQIASGASSKAIKFVLIASPRRNSAQPRKAYGTYADSA